MGRLLLIVSGTIITVALIILFLLLYRYATDGTDNIQRDIASEIEEVKLSKNQVTAHWIQDLAQKKRPSFIYPVKEIEIELPLIKKSKLKETYRLVLNRMDEYKLFCVKQIFSRKNLPFALYSEKDHTVVMVHNVDLKKLKKIAKYVSSYGIDIKIENYTKRD